MTKAIFYDLQGTLGGEATANIDSFSPYPFAKEALALAKNKGYLNIIITNQSKISKGILVLTGGGKDSLGKFRSTWADHEADMIAENVLEAIMSI